MPFNQYTLKEKKSLTKDVFELTFMASENFDFIAGQFVTFVIPEIGGRAYSVLETQGKEVILIIKKRSAFKGGRGGSEYICNLNIGDILQGTKPAGKFNLQLNNKNKLFIGTGTGFVPLYNQIKSAITNNLDCNLTLLFGIRYDRDLFYVNELKKLRDENNNFNFEIYLSRSVKTGHNIGYVTKYMTDENINLFDEFYICGIPSLIESSQEILMNNGIEIKNIYTEKY